MSEEKRCAQCGAALTADAPHGLCPACLLKRGFASSTGAGESNQGARTEFVPPAPAELARYFPELEILELLGRGGMGVVYKARQKRLDRLVALKILPSNVSREPAFAERFTREAKALARLTHPNIVTVHDFGQTNGLFYFVMEFVDGMNLRQLLDAGRITPKEALAIVPQICDALQYAHDKGIVHRDIKPENILLGKDGVVKIADFGLAKLVGLEAKDLTITSARDVIGTPLYMAPEQIEHPQDVDHRADIYSLGVVFYQMLTGELPIGRFAPPSRRVQIDVRLDEVVLRALEKEPKHRYQHASDVKTQVETIAATGSAGVPPAKPGVVANPTKQVLRWMLYDERTGRRHFNWPFLLLFCSQIGLVVNGTLLVMALVLWLLNVKPPHGKTFASPDELWRMLIWTAAFAVTRRVALMALNQDSNAWRWTGWIRQARNYKPRTVIAMCLVLVISAVLAGGLAFSFPWMHARFVTAVADVHLPTGGNTARAVVWIGIVVVVGLFIRRVWPAVNRPVAAPAPPVQKLDRFWRRFAVTVVALIATPFVIVALLMILTPLFIIFFERHERAQEVGQQTAQDATAMPEQQRLAQSDGVGLATTSFSVGQTWFPNGDSIEITSVVRTKERLMAKGHYNLVSHDSALLALFITTTNREATSVETKQKLNISKGAGDFELVHTDPVPGLPHVSMYADGHPFAALYFGTKAEALEERAASWITNTPPSSADAEEDLGQTVASSRPVVVETQPVSGATDVEPGITEIHVRFNKRMAEGSWSWCTAWENSTPEFIGKPRYEADDRTCVAKVKLEPGQTYAFWLNSGQFMSFADRAGRPAVPYLLTFQTRPN